MEMKDYLAVSHWVRGKASLADVESAESVGILGNVRFTPHAVRLYRLLWLWSAMRMGPEHDRAWEKLGRDGYRRRIERGLQWAAKFAK